MNRRFCEDCEIDIHRASYSKHLRSEKHIKNEINMVNNRIKITMDELKMLPSTYIKLLDSSGNEINSR